MALALDKRQKLIYHQTKYKISKGYNVISKDLGIPVSTMCNALKKFACNCQELPWTLVKEKKSVREVFQGW